jgi:hypothetical protein
MRCKASPRRPNGLNFPTTRVVGKFGSVVNTVAPTLEVMERTNRRGFRGLEVMRIDAGR